MEALGVLKSFYVNESNMEEVNRSSNKFQEAIQANLNLHTGGSFKYDPIRAYKASYRLKLIELFKIPNGKSLTRKGLRIANQLRLFLHTFVEAMPVLSSLSIWGIPFIKKLLPRFCSLMIAITVKPWSM